MPVNAEAWQAYALSEAQLAHFETHGYVADIPLLNEAQIEALRTDLAQFMAADYEPDPRFYEFHRNESGQSGQVLFHALGAWRISPAFHDTLWNPAFLKPASQLLGNRPVRFWHDQLFCKPARHGGVVAWHQDYSYWTRTIPMQHLTCWIGLDDADEDNGCLQYVPGSHRWGLLEKPELAGSMERIKDYLSEEQQAAFKPVPIPLKKGHAAFHHPLLLHGSYENRTDRPRRAMVLNVFADGTVSHASEPLLTGVPAIAKGEKMQGDFFPMLYDAASVSPGA
jgi:ectoine hydroxylase-related dioxygenase (phytanoyl-CoA dioxygenase family)